MINGPKAHTTRGTTSSEGNPETLKTCTKTQKLLLLTKKRHPTDVSTHHFPGRCRQNVHKDDVRPNSHRGDVPVKTTTTIVKDRNLKGRGVQITFKRKV